MGVDVKKKNNSMHLKRLLIAIGTLLPSVIAPWISPGIFPTMSELHSILTDSAELSTLSLALLLGQEAVSIAFAAAVEEVGAASGVGIVGPHRQTLSAVARSQGLQAHFGQGILRTLKLIQIFNIYLCN